MLGILSALGATIEVGGAIGSARRCDPASLRDRSHAEAGDGYAKFWLEPTELAESSQLKGQELRRARLLVDRNKALFLEKWREYFGS